MRITARKAEENAEKPADGDAFPLPASLTKRLFHVRHGHRTTLPVGEKLFPRLSIQKRQLSAG
jgi:hypothetical protein